MSGLVRKFIHFMYDKDYRFNVLCLLGFYRNTDDRKFLEKLFRVKFPYKIDFENPKTFNEKMNWLKLYDRKQIYSDLADKYKVKGIVAHAIGEKYIVPNIAMYKLIEDVEWEKLPEKFVLKANHDSSGAIICRDKSKIDINYIKKKYSKILKNNYFYSGREWPYKNIEPCILIDQYLEDSTSTSEGNSLRDYKFWCFNGEPLYMYCTVKGTDVYENFYDMDFNPVKIDHGFPRHNPDFDRPKGFEEMKKLASILAKLSEAPFVRIDFFDIDGKVYFGEFTFYDWGGMRPFVSYEMDYKLGDLIKLPNKN